VDLHVLIVAPSSHRLVAESGIVRRDGCCMSGRVTQRINGWTNRRRRRSLARNPGRNRGRQCRRDRPRAVRVRQDRLTNPPWRVGTSRPSICRRF
jgi:hypothetical protein